MHLLYEEDGEFKVGTVLAQAPASFQVESPHGRRSRIKAANVLLSFERPGAAELLGAAQAYAAGSTPISCGSAAVAASSVSRTWRGSTWAASRARSKPPACC